MREIISGAHRGWFTFRELRPPTRALIATLAALIAASLVFTGNAAADRVGANGTLITKTLLVGGLARSYLVYRPTSYVAGVPTPLVIVLPGSHMSGERMASLTRFNAEADQGRFLVAYPNGLSGGTRGLDPDVQFVGRTIDDVGSDYNLDERRVYATGLSSGGVLAYTLACQAADRFAAVGIVAATLRNSTCNPSQPVSVVHIHGTDDPVFPYAGRGGRGSSTSIPSVIARWRQFDGCVGLPIVQVNPPVTKDSSRTCRLGSEVTLYTVQGGSHTWFGAQPGGPNGAIDATETIARFFEAHSKP